MRIFVCAVVLAIAAFGLWGVGSAMRRLAGSRRGSWPATIGVGVAALVFVGGVLNLSHVAYRPMMWVVIVAMLAMAAREIATARGRGEFAGARNAMPQDVAGRIGLTLAAVVIAAMMLFTIGTQLPPGQFNYHDDLQKYFAHPVRMLETGTLAGSPLSALGSETLGGQAFLHGLVASFAPLAYINGVDAVFGLLLLMLMAAAAAWRRFGWFPGAALGAAVITLINPQYVNVSALYLGAALMATAILLAADEREASPPNAMLLGLVYAALVALKPTFGVFAALHGVFVLPAVRAEAGTWKRTATWAARTGACAIVAVAPWFLIHAANYVAHGDMAGGKELPNGNDLDGANLFSTERLFDGDSVASYTALAALAAFVAVLALVAWLRRREEKSEEARPAGIFAGAATGVASFAIVIFYLGLYAGYQQSVRYVTPFVLGACVIPALLAPRLEEKIPRVASVLIPAVACVAVTVSFVPGATDRVRQAQEFGSILAFPPLAESPQYVKYMRTALSDEARARVQSLQDSVPPSEPLLAWINTPFYLDYQRNPIVDVDTAGIATPWARIPGNVHYYLWQYQGYGVRTQGDYLQRMHVPGARERLIAEKSRAFANRITELANHAHVIANDDGFVLFRVDGGAK